MDLFKVVIRFIRSILESIITTLTCNFLIAVLIGVNPDLNSLISFFNRNLNIISIIFIIFLILFYQRKRITEKWELYEPHPKATPYGTSFFLYKNLLWEICIEHSEYIYEKPPYFNYYIGRALCPNPIKNRACLTPLVISDKLMAYTEYCANCKKKYLRFRGYEKDKYEIQTIIDSLILKNNIQKAEDLADIIPKYIQEKINEHNKNLNK